VVVDVGLTAVFLGRVLVWLVAVGHGRMVVLVLVGGGEVRPVLTAAEIVGHMGMFVVVDLGIVAVLLAHGQTLLPPDNRPICCSAVGGVADITAIADVRVTVAAGVRGIAVIAVELGDVHTHGGTSSGSRPASDTYHPREIVIPPSHRKGSPVSTLERFPTAATLSGRSGSP
jgi:hypothetical protein